MAHTIELAQQSRFLIDRKRQALADINGTLREHLGTTAFTTTQQRDLELVRARIQAIPEPGNPFFFRKRRLQQQNKETTEAFQGLEPFLQPTLFKANPSVEDAVGIIKNRYFAPTVPEHTPPTAQQRVESALRDMKTIVDPHGSSRGKGRLRGTLLPIATGLAASYSIDQLLKQHAHEHSPAVDTAKAIFSIGGGAWTAGIVIAGLSLGASTVLRLIGRHNHLDMYARYSHIGGLSDETIQKIPKVDLHKPDTYLNGVTKLVLNTSLQVGRFIERGIERGILKHVVFRIGENRKTATLVNYADGMIDVDSWSLRKKSKYLKEGFKYLRDGEVLRSKNGKNAHFTKNENTTWSTNNGKVKIALVNLLGSIPNQEEQYTAMHKVEKKLNSKFRNSTMYWAGALTLAATGAMKAMLVDTIGNTKNGLRAMFKQTTNGIDKLHYFFTHPYRVK